MKLLVLIEGKFGIYLFHSESLFWFFKISKTFLKSHETSFPILYIPLKASKPTATKPLTTEEPDITLCSKASRPSLGSSASLAGFSWVFNIFSKMVTSMTSRPCWHQWQFHQHGHQSLLARPSLSMSLFPFTPLLSSYWLACHACHHQLDLCH